REGATIATFVAASSVRPSSSGTPLSVVVCALQARSARGSRASQRALRDMGPSVGGELKDLSGSAVDEGWGGVFDHERIGRIVAGENRQSWGKRRQSPFVTRRSGPAVIYSSLSPNRALPSTRGYHGHEG